MRRADEEKGDPKPRPRPPDLDTEQKLRPLVFRPLVTDVKLTPTAHPRAPDSLFLPQTLHRPPLTARVVWRGRSVGRCVCASVHVLPRGELAACSNRNFPNAVTEGVTSTRRPQKRQHPAQQGRTVPTPLEGCASAAHSSCFRPSLVDGLRRSGLSSESDGTVNSAPVS